MPNLIVPPRDLPSAPEVFDDSVLVVDTGAGVFKATPAQVVDVARPYATIQEGEDGIASGLTMTPLTTAAAITAQVGDAVAEGALMAKDPPYVPFATVADGVQDVTGALNAALVGGRTHVRLPKGTYYLGDYIRLYSDTLLEMHPDAVILSDFPSKATFMNGESGNTTFSSGYSGPGNITIRGGVFDMSLKRAGDYSGPAIGISHARDILIENVIFKNHRPAHYIELNSTQHAVVRGCTFRDNAIIVPGSREFINIDYSYATGYPQHGAYDNTPCDDILIASNVFLNGDVAVGSHALSPLGRHTRIICENNFVDTMMAKGFDARFWDVASCKFRNNQITNVPDFMEYDGVANIDGKVFLRLEDDDAIALDVPMPFAAIAPQGLIQISSWSGQAGAPRGMYWIICGPTPAIETIAASANQASVELTTGPLATGTTGGTDGRFLISPANDGKLYLKNRSGTFRRLEVRFMAD